MESSEPLAIESFSHSWLTSVKSPLDGLEESYRPSLDSFLELDYRILKKEVHNFNFDVPNSEFPDPLAHADQLFSDGIINPLYINKPNSFFTPAIVSSSASSRIVDVQCNIFKRWRKSVEQILLKCSGYLTPLCYKVIGTRKSRRVVDIDRRAKQVRSSPQLSPALTYSSNDFCDIEHSIHEAILHCKRSTDK